MKEQLLNAWKNHKDFPNLLKAAWLESPLGPMVAIGDEKALYVLEFLDWRKLEQKIEELSQQTKSAIAIGSAPPLLSIEQELVLYFKGQLQAFKTPLALVGSPFQKQVWEGLTTIPYGETRSYAEMALALGKPTAYRATAQANGANPIAIVIPCHRVINANGKLGGYGGGLNRKQWLLNHERHT